MTPTRRITEWETCEDRAYECCDLTPPIGADGSGDQTTAEYEDWYDDHVTRWTAQAPGGAS